MNDAGVAIDYTPLGTNMEFEDLTLPRDKFNLFCYFFITHPHFTFVLALDLAVIGICPVWYNLIGSGFIFGLLLVLAMLLTFPTLLIGFAADDTTNGEVLSDTRSSVSLLGEVAKFRPGLDGDKWDLIAARLNRIFRHNNNKVTPYFFYDGAKCHSHFKQYYVLPTKARDANRSGTQNADEDSSGVRDANRSEIANFLQPKIDEAVKMYIDSEMEYLEEYWRPYAAQTNDISEQNNVRNDSDKDQTVS